MDVLTPNQARYLTILKEGPLSVRELLNKLALADTKDMIHSSLRRMEDRELVRRLGGRPAAWELTLLGRKTLTYYLSNKTA